MVFAVNRRGVMGLAAAAAASSGLARAEAFSGALSSRAHFQIRPATKESFIHCFSDVIGLGPPAKIHVPGFPEPLLAYRFPGGGAFSVEVTPDALDEALARRGAWLEIRTTDPVRLKNDLTAAGYARLAYPATTNFYFAAPGGQVFGVLGSNVQEALPPGVTVSR